MVDAWTVVLLGYLASLPPLQQQSLKSVTNAGAYLDIIRLTRDRRKGYDKLLLMLQGLIDPINRFEGAIDVVVQVNSAIRRTGVQLRALRTLLAQLLQSNTVPSKAIEEIYYNNGRKVAQSLVEVQVALPLPLQATQLPDVYIVIDSLDECQKNLDLVRILLEFTSSLATAQKAGSLKTQCYTLNCEHTGLCSSTSVQYLLWINITDSTFVTDGDSLSLAILEKALQYGSMGEPIHDPVPLIRKLGGHMVDVFEADDSPARVTSFIALHASTSSWTPQLLLFKCPPFYNHGAYENLTHALLGSKWPRLATTKAAFTSSLTTSKTPLSVVANHLRVCEYSSFIRSFSADIPQTMLMSFARLDLISVCQAGMVRDAPNDAPAAVGTRLVKD
ncbi:hypothetical protein B7494_g7441 [Chlorociboria aeruginascens]|nr:hypothetical protein B7494_g7441 [Chlorociboria aeruginascens]